MAPSAHLLRARLQPAARDHPLVRCLDRAYPTIVGMGMALTILLGALGAEWLPVALEGPAARRVLVVALLLNLALTLIGIASDRRLRHRIDAHDQLHARTLALAAHDHLTSLTNRRALAEIGGGTISAAERRGKAVAMIAIDLDNFRCVNDVRGHDRGDELLVAIAGALTALAPPSALLARLGGDEFACLLPFDPDHPHIVDMLTDRILARLGLSFALADGEEVRIGASIGIARSDPQDPGIDRLLRRADIAMAAAKQAGGRRARWFDTGMERELTARNTIETQLRAAIPAGRIVPYYEQQIDLTSGTLLGFEVLARWLHPSEGMIPPDRFIAIAEESGLISDLSMAVMRQAFEDAAGWDPMLTLSVNISPAQLKDPWLAEKIVKLLAETGFPARRLEVEITETSLLDNLPLAQSIVGSLKNQGIRLALDDFGTGYSSLSHLRALPFDRIKIDKSFVLAMLSDPESAAIVETIAQLGRSLSVPVTAEGIDNAAIVERLVALGCQKGQGFLYGRPMPVMQARRLLADRSLLATARDVA